MNDFINIVANCFLHTLAPRRWWCREQLWQIYYLFPRLALEFDENFRHVYSHLILLEPKTAL